MLRFIFGFFGLLLTAAATALTILANMGQLTENTVARHIYFVHMDVSNIGASISNTTGANGNLFASDQTAAVEANQGLKYQYYWGMYRFCAGAGVNDDRSCSESYIGYRWEPAATLTMDAQATYSGQLQNILGTDVAGNSDYLGRLSRVANVILLVGTILTGLAFLTSFLAHRFCFAFAALECLGAAGCLAVGAAIYTAIIFKARATIPANVDVSIDYGNALWMVWGAFAAVAVAIIPMIIACCVGGGRNKY